MSPLTLEKMTTPARLAAAPIAARWNQKTVADARDGGERARSGAGGRKGSVARGGALQNDDAVDDGDVYRLVGRRTRSRTQAKDASSHASCCSSAGGGDDGVRHEHSARAILNLSDAESVLLQSRERAAIRPRACADSHDHGHDHSNSNATVADRPRQMSRRRAPADDDGEGASIYGDYCGNNTMRLRAAPPGSVGVLGNRKIISPDILMEQQADVSTADKTLGEHHNSNAMVADRPRQMSRRRAPADDDGEGASKNGDYCKNEMMRFRAAPASSVGVLENRGKKLSGATYTTGPASVTTAIMECHEPPIQLSCVDTESMSLHGVKRMANLIGPTTSLRYFTSDYSVPIVGTELYENGCFAVETGVCADEQQKHAFVAEQRQQQGQWRPQQVRAELRTATAFAAAAGKDTCKKRMPIEAALYDRYRHHRVGRARGRKNHVFALSARIHDRCLCHTHRGTVRG